MARMHVFIRFTDHFLSRPIIYGDSTAFNSVRGASRRCRRRGWRPGRRRPRLAQRHAHRAGASDGAIFFRTHRVW
jgi:hypothetical protein